MAQHLSGHGQTRFEIPPLGVHHRISRRQFAIQLDHQRSALDPGLPQLPPNLGVEFISANR